MNLEEMGCTMKSIFRTSIAILVILIGLSLLPMNALAAPTPVTVQGLQFSATTDYVTFPTVGTDNIKVNLVNSLAAWKTTEDTVTVTNITGKKVNISFSFTKDGVSTGDAANVNGCTISGSTATVTLEDGGTFTLYLKNWKSSSGTANTSITLSGITVEEVKSSVNVEVQYNTSLGSVYDHTSGTTSDSSTLVGAGSTVTTSEDIPRVLYAKANSDAQFLGWVDGNYQLKSTDETYTVKTGTESSITVKAIFASASTEACFWTDSQTYLFDSLSGAATRAYSSSNKVVVLAASGTLTSGTYTIPSGVQLLIPFSATDGGDFDLEPQTDESKYPINSGLTPFRTLTIPDNTTITCYGDINVNSTLFTDKAMSGAPYGPFGRIILEGANSNLVMESGSKLYCYGYITGKLSDDGETVTKGKVTVKDGATIYECFQLLGYRGGAAMESWANQSGVTDKDYTNPAIRSFAFSEYAIQNVEADLQLDYGATAIGVTAFTYKILIRTNTYFTSLTYISKDDGLVQMKQGSKVLRSYDAINDRVTYELTGEVDFGKLVITINMDGTTATLDSSNHILGLNRTMKFVAKEGSKVTLLYNYALMPGSIVFVEEGATLYVENDLYIYDSADAIYDGDPDYSYVYHQSGHAELNCILVPYICTTGLKSDIYSDYYYGVYSSYDPILTNSSPCAHVVINGTLVVNGGIYTTTGDEDNNNDKNADKVITGTGTIINTDTSATSVRTDVLDNMTQHYDDTTTSAITGENSFTGVIDRDIEATPLIALLAGVSSSDEDLEHSMGAATYYGQDNGYWYQHIISTNIADVITVTSGSGTDGTALSPMDGREVENIVGLVADEGTITFTVNGDYVVSVGDDELKPDDNGTYTIGEITADTTITLDYRAVKLDAINASADSEIILMLYFTDPYGLLSDTDTVTVTKTTVGANGTTQTEKVYTVSELETDFDAEENKTYYVVRQPAASGEMTSPVTVTFTTSNGSTIPVYDYVSGTCGNSITRTVRDYAERALKLSTDENQIDIIKALVTYGGYSQTFFGTNKDDLAYSILEDGVPSLGYVSITEGVSRSETSIGITQTTQQAYLNSAIYLRVYFVLSDGMNIDNYKFTLTSPKGGSTVTDIVNPVKEETDTGVRYYVDILNIPAAYLDNTYTITVTGNGGTYTVETSVFAYLKDVLEKSTDENQINAAKAMYLYGTAATTFFGK